MSESEPNASEPSEPVGAPDATLGTETQGSTAKKRAPRDADGMDRPPFLLDFPEDPELERLISAFERGNYALVRRDAEKLAQATANPAVRDAALELRRRIDPDPLAKYLLGVAVMLLVFLVIWAYRMQSR